LGWIVGEILSFLGIFWPGLFQDSQKLAKSESTQSQVVGCIALGGAVTGLVVFFFWLVMFFAFRT
jgi:hypothetical protein